MPEFTFHGVKELRELIHLLPELALDAAQPAMVDAIFFLHGQLPGYPPAIPGSSYKRRVSGGLGGSFTEHVSLESNAVIGELGTNLTSAPWVVGPDWPGEQIGGRQKFQAQIHVDRWWQFADVVAAAEAEAWDEFEQKFWPEFRDRIQQAADKMGGQRDI